METIRWNMSPAEIEQESFRRIEAECDLHCTLSAPHWRVARRLIHTTADMHIADTLVFRHDPVAAGLAALHRKAPIFCDSQMRPVQRRKSPSPAGWRHRAHRQCTLGPGPHRPLYP